MTLRPTFRDDKTTAVDDGSARQTLRVRGAQLEVREGPDAGRTARIDKPTFIVGSGSAADLRLTDDTVSREHALFSLSAEGVQVRDQGSTNGTWIGTMRIHGALLTVTTALSVGSTELRLEIDATPLDLPLSTNDRFGEAIGGSSLMRHLFAVLDTAARSDTTILLEGESGVGKEVLAQAVHTTSARATGPFVTLDCGAIPAGLVESELFGHERGAFTGADRARAGAFEQANGGTLFLDEIGELPLEMQPKLLRVLETREVRRVGASAAKPLDVRIVAATNRNLAEASQKNEFRRDLFYRLAVVRVTVPPLRDRREDVVALAHLFLQRTAGLEDRTLPPDLVAMLTAYPWPGNVRELRNVMERYTVLGPNPAALFDGSVGRPSGKADPLAEPTSDLSHLRYHEARRVAIDRFERSYLPAVLQRAGNVVVRAAELADVGRGSFHRMLQRIRSPQADDGDDDG